MSSAGDGKAWRVVPGSTFRWRGWDDEFVLYHDESGDTHRFNAVGARALEALGRSPLPITDLAARLAGEFPGAVDDTILPTIEELVRRFHDLGLIEPVDRQGQPADDSLEPDTAGNR